MSGRSTAFVQLNGRLVRAPQARVSVFDRGFLYGDGLFETLRTYRGHPFALDEHVARLQASADFLGFVVPRRPWRRDIGSVVEKNGLSKVDAWVRIMVTRGVSPRSLLPPARPRPALIVMAGALDPAIARLQRCGARVTLLPFSRSGFLAEHKVLNYLPGVLGKVMAARHAAFEGLYVDAAGNITEGTTTNVFAWRNKRLLTPPIDGILPGLTRRMVIELATTDGMRVKEQVLTPDNLLDADEAFLTSSLAEVVPLVAINAHSIGDGTVGARTQRLQKLYRQMVDQALAMPRRN
jgi:branched-chain amino acid aminotransferase